MTATRNEADDYAADELRVPEWDLADRLTKALRVSGVGVAEIALVFGVSRQTIGRWLNGHTVPNRAALYLFADATGVDLRWLETGEASPEAERLRVLRARRDSNPKPSDLYPRPVLRLIRGTEAVKPALTAYRRPAGLWAVGR